VLQRCRVQVSRDVLGRWAFPFTPDTNLLHAEPSAPWATGSTYHYSRGNVYRCCRHSSTHGRVAVPCFWEQPRMVAAPQCVCAWCAGAIDHTTST
jgi:hypothetical protein